MIMSKFKASAIGMAVLGIGAWLFPQTRAGTRLNNEVLSLKAELQQLSEQVAALQQDRTNLPPPAIEPVQPPSSENQSADLSRLRSEIGHLRERIAQMEQANAA